MFSQIFIVKALLLDCQLRKKLHTVVPQMVASQTVLYTIGALNPINLWYEKIEYLYSISIILIVLINSIYAEHSDAFYYDFMNQRKEVRIALKKQQCDDKS